MIITLGKFVALWQSPFSEIKKKKDNSPKTLHATKKKKKKKNLGPTAVVFGHVQYLSMAVK